MLRPGRLLLVLLVAGGVSTGCSLKKLAIGSLADTLAAGGDVFASDDDPELIRAAVPFSLKTIESLLVEVPDHPGLLLAACTGFTQYAYAFVQADAELIGDDDFERTTALRERARRMYLRATRYCLRRLDLKFPGIEQALDRDPKAALTRATLEDVPVLYWTGAAWGSAVAQGLDQPELIADLPIARELMVRALELDESHADGAIHAAMIALDALPEAMGGSIVRARRHFERAVDLTGGKSAGPYVSLATSVALPAEDRAEFERLLQAALAIDPDAVPSWRLANLISQRLARRLLARADTLFIESPPGDSGQQAMARFGAAGIVMFPRAEHWVRVPHAPRDGGTSRWSR